MQRVKLLERLVEALRVQMVSDYVSYTSANRIYEYSQMDRYHYKREYIILTSNFLYNLLCELDIKVKGAEYTFEDRNEDGRSYTNIHESALTPFLDKLDSLAAKVTLIQRVQHLLYEFVTKYAFPSQTSTETALCDLIRQECIVFFTSLKGLLNGYFNEEFNGGFFKFLGFRSANDKSKIHDSLWALTDWR